MKWRLVGLDTFSREWYGLEGQFEAERDAIAAAQARFAELRAYQPALHSGGAVDGIQDRVYIVDPNGNEYCYGVPDPQGHYRELQFMSADNWNSRRKKNRDFRPNLSWTDLSGANLEGFDLSRAVMVEADLRHSKLAGVDLSSAILTGSRFDDADLRGANLIGADLEGTTFVRTELEGADISRSRIYGISIWDIGLDKVSQQALVITPRGIPAIQVDDIEIAQFIYLLLSHRKIRKVIDAVSQRGVLILGRFGGGGIEVLDTVASVLRQEGYLPFIFDFERPHNRDFTETVQVLAGLSRFVIVDLSGPSVPQELMATVPHFAVPFLPILEAGRVPHSMFTDLKKYPWVARTVCSFHDTKDLVQRIQSDLIAEAERLMDKCRHEKT